MNLLHKIAATSLFALSLPLTSLAANPAPINLGTAGNFVILTKTGISTTGTTAITGDIGLSPAAASYITGFALTLPSAGAYSTSALVTGNVYAPGYADPTPATLTTAVLDMQTAYTDAAGRAAGVTELGAGNIGGLTLAPDVYTWGTGVTIPSDVILAGNANDVWIFQIAQNLNISSGVHIVLSGGAKASNIFWQVAGQTTIGTGASMSGIILDQTAVVFNTGATLSGRALAQTAVTLDSNTVTAPSNASVQTPVPTIPAVPATPAVPAVTPAVPATPATPTTNTVSGLTTGQQQLYNQLISAGANSSIALGAVNQMTTPAVSSLPSSSFSQQVRAIARDLKMTNGNDDVTLLQQFLISENKGPASLALKVVGATSYFGELTRAALAEFQASVGISPAVGYFGSITRTYLSAH